MGILEKIQILCKEKGINPTKLEAELGFGKGTLYKWRKSSPNTDKLLKVADYFGVSLDYLVGNAEFRTVSDEEFTKKDRKDIAKKMNAMLEQLDYQEALMFDGEVLDDETKELLKDSLLNSLKVGKAMAKKKFTPKKYKK